MCVCVHECVPIGMCECACLCVIDNTGLDEYVNRHVVTYISVLVLHVLVQYVSVCT